MAIVSSHNPNIPEDSGSGPGNTLTDAEKNQNASNYRRAVMKKLIWSIKVGLDQIENEGVGAPGSYADLDGLMPAGDQTEAADLCVKLRDVVNLYKLSTWSNARYNGA